MNKIKFAVLGVAAFVIGMSVQHFALSDVPSKIAVVDVQKVVASSSQVKALKKEQQNKASEIIKYVEKARKDVAAVTDEKKKKSLEDKYNKELITKREKLEKEYASKLAAIDKSISDKIVVEAKNGGYDIVLAKGVVLYGGTDITNNVIKAVK